MADYESYLAQLKAERAEYLAIIRAKYQESDPGVVKLIEQLVTQVELLGDALAYARREEAVADHAAAVVELAHARQKLDRIKEIVVRFRNPMAQEIEAIIREGEHW